MTGSIVSKPSTFQLSSTCSIRHCSIETETRRGCLKCLNEKRRSCSRSKGLEKTKTRIPRSQALSYFKHELVHRPIHVWGKRNVQLLTRFSGKGSFSPGYILRRDCFTKVYFVWAGPLIRFPFENTRIVEGFLLARRDEMRGSSDTVLWTLREYANTLQLLVLRWKSTLASRTEREQISSKLPSARNSLCYSLLFYTDHIKRTVRRERTHRAPLWT